jgi:integrase
MPRLTKSIPAYRHHKASGQAVVTLDGRDHYLGPWQSKASRVRYDQLTGEWLANGRQLPGESERSRTVEELMAAFWIHAERYYVGADGKPTKELDSYRQAMKPLRTFYGESLAANFGPSALKHIRQWMIEQDYARTHINHQVNRIRRIFKWGVENELVPIAVYQTLTTVSGLKRHRSAARETSPVTPVPDAFVDAVLPFVSPQVGAMIELQRITGMRSGELTSMRTCDINTSGIVWEYRPTQHKTAYQERERVVYLGPKAQEILRPYLRTDIQAFLFSPAEAEAQRNARRRLRRVTPVTPSQSRRRPKTSPARPRGNRYSPDSYRQAVEYAIKKAGVPHWHPHQLRHNAATRLRRDHGLDIAQIVLGHARADVTQVYAEADRNKVIEVIRHSG